MNLKRYSLSFAVALALVAAGCSAPQAPEEQQEEQPVSVQVETATTGTVSNAAGLTGKLAPVQEVQVVPKVAGKIKELPVSMGQQVQQGDLLFVLDEADLRQGVAQAEAAYNLALASFKQAGTSSTQGLEQAKSAFEQAQTALEDAKRNEERMRILFQDGAISKQQMEQATIALSSAQSAYNNAKTALEAAQQQTGVAVSEASVNQARVALENAREQLANARVTSPISGYVASVNGNVGEMASPQMPVVVVVKTDPLLVKVNVSEQEIGSVKQGDTVTVEITSSGQQLEATVTAVSPVMDQQLKAYPVEISIPNPDGELKAGMIARVKLANGNGSGDTIVLPRQAVIIEQGKRYVFKAEGDTAVKTEVEVGDESSKLIEIISGVNAGDQIIVRGHTVLKDGDKIRVQSAQ